jgi:radical SAM superfamily enzyme YgiQ (UPF0313 family)
MPKLLLINPCNRVSLYGDYHWEPLSLAYVAACTPPGWEVELVDEQIEGERSYDGCTADLVGLTAFTTQATRAYKIAADFRARGVPVALGGIHASLVPDEAARHADAICLGECEGVFARLVADAMHGTLQPRYQGTALPLGERSTTPDRRIFSKYSYRYASSQTSRGCPMDCSFCSVTAFNGRAFRMRAVADVVEELKALPARDVLLVDDDLNGFSRQARARCLDLFRAMIAARLGKQWITQVTINFGDDDELPALAREAGCAGVFIGLESTDTASLARIRKDGKSQRRGTAYYEDNLARIRARGIGVVGSFILGIDTQDMSSIVGDILSFAERTGLDALNPTILTPLPGTRDYQRIAAEGRLLFTDYPADWEKYTLAFPVMTMPHTTGAALMKRYFELFQFFRPERVEALYHQTAATVSPEAARHAYLWNRAWSNYGLRHGLFRRAPLAATYPRQLPDQPGPEPIDANQVSA